MPTAVPNAEAGSARRRVDDPCSRMAVDARRWRRERFQWRHAGHDGVGRRKKTGGEEKKRGGGACRTTFEAVGVWTAMQPLRLKIAPDMSFMSLGRVVYAIGLRLFSGGRVAEAEKKNS